MSSVAKGKNGSDALMPQVIGALLSLKMLKPNQGRVVRQATFFTVLVISIISAYAISNWLCIDVLVMWTCTGVLSAIGAWLAYRLINIPVFSDFLIGVEAEMRKVTWPNKKEVYSGSVVVLFVIILLAGSMFVFDIIWTVIFQWLRVR